MKISHKQYNRMTPLIVFSAAAVCAALAAGGCGRTSGTAAGTGLTADLSQMHGTRDNTPEVLVPSKGSTDLVGDDDVSIDLSNQEKGYFLASYHGTSDKVKLQVTTADSMVYTYNLPSDGSEQVFSFSDGDGPYQIGVYTNIRDTLYATEYETSTEVELDSPYSPFLYPNQYVWFTADTEAVSRGAGIVEPADTDLDAVTLVYDYIVNNITYDWEEADTVQNGYIPDVDEVLATGKGICFDYSSLMAAMLRSQRIPTRMEIGYIGSTYHAWISTYIDEIGWVNGIIRFDGTDWSIMDPTLASTEGSAATQNYISDASQYRTVYLY